MSDTLSKARTSRHREHGRNRKRVARGQTVRRALGRLGVAAGLVVATLALHALGPDTATVELAPGQRAPYAVNAAVDFVCADFRATEEKRAELQRAVAPVFSVRTRELERAQRALDRLLDQVEAVREAGPERADEAREALAASLAMFEAPVQAEELLASLPAEDFDGFRERLQEAFRAVWNQGVMSETDRDTRFRGQASRDEITLLGPGDTRRPLVLSRLLLPSEAATEVAARLQTGEAPPGQARVLARLMGIWMAPSLVYEPSLTEQARQEAARHVPTVQQRVRAQETIVDKGEIVTPQILEKLRAHQQRLGELESPVDRLLDRAGGAGILGLLLVSMGIGLALTAPEAVRSVRPLLMLATISLVTLIACQGVVYLAFLDPAWARVMAQILPMPVAALLATVLAGPVAGLFTGFWTSAAASVLAGNHLGVLVLGTVQTSVAVAATRSVQQRSRLVRSGSAIALASILTTLALAALDRTDLTLAATQSLAAVGLAIACPVAIMVLLPLFELAFGVTTDLRFLELSDLSHPLLQRLALEAPGTYHHSLMVANLAQSAAQAIGANDLHVRVCAYFHDIGKLAKPEYFVENLSHGDNPHDTLSPHMSALIIIAHVKEGLAMARSAKLPRPIHDAIRQHHGTSLIAYFYHRAGKQVEAGGDRRTVSPADFRYDGPRPQTREMGILLLADSLEAASRAMAKPTAGRIQQLVDQIVAEKIADGQLDDCNLTFRDVAAIKRSMLFNLTNILHARVPYPTDESGPLQPPEPIPAPLPESEAADALARATG